MSPHENKKNQIKLLYTDRQRYSTVNFCHVLYEAHKHELHKLTMTKILSKARGYLNLLILFTRFVG